MAIGLQDYAFVKPPIDIFGLIEKANIPFLDIYGSRDYKKATDQVTVAQKLFGVYKTIESITNTSVDIIKTNNWLK